MSLPRPSRGPREPCRPARRRRCSPGCGWRRPPTARSRRPRSTTRSRPAVAAAVAEPGTVLVSGRLLAECSRALPGKPVDVVLDGTRVNVTCGSSRFTLLTMPVEDYPALPEMPAHAGSVDADAFAEA